MTNSQAKETLAIVIKGAKSRGLPSEPLEREAYLLSIEAFQIAIANLEQTIERDKAIERLFGELKQG